MCGSMVDWLFVQGVPCLCPQVALTTTLHRDKQNWKKDGWLWENGFHFSPGMC